MDKKPDINWELVTGVASLPHMGVETTTCYTKALVSLYCVTLIDVELVAFGSYELFTAEKALI